MNKDEMKKYAKYGGIGLLLCFLGWSLYYETPLWFMFFISLVFLHLLLPIAGGIVGGVMAKKWWGAILGGSVGFLIGYFVIDLLTLYWD
jgi:hypothetical protein